MCRHNPDHLDDGKALLWNSTDINKHRWRQSEWTRWKSGRDWKKCTRAPFHFKNSILNIVIQANDFFLLVHIPVNFNTYIDSFNCLHNRDTERFYHPINLPQAIPLESHPLPTHTLANHWKPPFCITIVLSFQELSFLLLSPSLTFQWRSLHVYVWMQRTPNPMPVDFLL